MCSCNDIDYHMNISIEYQDSKSNGFKNAIDKNFLNVDTDKEIIRKILPCENPQKFSKKAKISLPSPNELNMNNQSKSKLERV